MRSVSVVNRTALIIGAAVFAFLGVAGLLLSFLLPVPFVKTDYGLMIDAGSTKSELWIYQWPHKLDASIPHLEEAPGDGEDPYSFRVEPGISAYVGNPDGLRVAMQELLDYAMTLVPEDQYSITPLFLKATAGMRLLPIDEQEEILAVIREVFEASPFWFDETDGAVVISGQDEGVFGWVTVNHLSNKLEQDIPDETYGALDLGGASTQITFVPDQPAASDNYTLILDKLTYELFSKSYLYYGSDQARFGFNESLIPLNPSPLLDNPCLHLDFNSAGVNFTVNGTMYSLKGLSDYQSCETLIVQNLFSSAQFPPPSSDLRGLFYAFSGFAYTPQFFNLPPDASIEMLRQEGIIYCNLTWEEVLEKYPTTSPSFLTNYCFNAAYIVAMLVYGYGFDPSTRGEITFMTEIDDVALTWPLGAMLFEATNLPAIEELTTPLYETFFGIATIVISVVFLLIGFAMFLFFRHSQHNRNTEIQQKLLDPVD